jgi:hypothetical protein
MFEKNSFMSDRYVSPNMGNTWPALEEIPFQLMLVATWATTWGAWEAYTEMVGLLRGSKSLMDFVIGFTAAVDGAVLLVVAVILFARSVWVRRLAILAFGVHAVSQASLALAGDVFAIVTVFGNGVAILLLAATRRHYRPERLDISEESGTRVGVN